MTRRNRKAEITNECCIDCGECIRQMLLPGNFQIFCTLFPHLLLVCGMGGECLRHGVLDL